MTDMAPDGRPTTRPETVEQWRSWLEANHDSATGVWVLNWKRHTGRLAVTYDDAVCEALAYGWIDSRADTSDGDTAMQWYSPRRADSAWSRLNKERVARLVEQGRMAPAGQRAVAVAKENGAWSRLDDVENLVVPADLAAALDAPARGPRALGRFPAVRARAVAGVDRHGQADRHAGASGHRDCRPRGQRRTRKPAPPEGLRSPVSVGAAADPIHALGRDRPGVPGRRRGRA